MDIITHSILPFVAMLVVLIVVHELGHFFTAKLAGVQVLEFGLGYPPRIWGIKRGETAYTINALPLGGFVRLLGEEDPSDPRSLAAQPRWIRLVVLSSGALMNVLLAVFLFSLALMIPREVDISKARISGVVPGSPAQEAGLQPGDVILAVNGREVQNLQELSYLIRLNLGETVRFRVNRPTNTGEGTGVLEIPVRARWSTDPYTVDLTSGPESAIVTSDTVPIDVTVPSTDELPSEGAITIDPGTEQEEQFFYIVKDATTITLTERALGDSSAQPHAGGALVRYEQEQGPTGITIAPAFGVQQALTPEEREELEEELPPGATVPRTKLVPFSETQWSPPWEALVEGARRSYESVILARNEIISRVRGGVGGGGGAQITGPVGIAQLTGEVVEEAGWKSLMDFAALISMNLAVLNILPLPMLDGGRVVFVLLEYVRGGRRIAPEKEALVHFVGLVVMLALAVVITYFDVLRIFEGEGIIR